MKKWKGGVGKINNTHVMQHLSYPKKKEKKKKENAFQ